MATLRPHGPRAADWQKIKNRLAASRVTAEATPAQSADRAQTLLEQRARALARVPDQAPAAGSLLEVVTFSLGSERYALQTRDVREVLRCKEVTRLPGAPAFLMGIFSLRGQFVALLDLRKFFGLPTPAATAQSRTLILGQERHEFGLLADAVHEVASLRMDELHEPPGSVAGITREYLRGITADSLILLDGDALLKDPRLTVDIRDNAGEMQA
jgi:purine-binding chemotaxis protein CheW